MDREIIEEPAAEAREDTAVIPASALAGRTYSEGDTITMRVLSVGEDGSVEAVCEPGTEKSYDQAIDEIPDEED